MKMILIVATALMALTVTSHAAGVTFANKGFTVNSPFGKTVPRL